MCLCQIPSVSWNPGSVQVSLSATRVPALFPRQCGNNASKSAGAGKLLFVTFLSHKRGPGREGLGEQGEQVPVDILTPLPPPPPPLLAVGRLARLEPSPRQTSRLLYARQHWLLSCHQLSMSLFLTHRSLINSRAINNTSALSPLTGCVNFGHPADSSPGGFLTSRRASFTAERMAPLFSPGFTLLPRPTDKCSTWSN